MVDLDGVSVRLGDVIALADASLTVNEGRFVGLIGPNGAGKTTLLRTITAAITPDAGRVRIAGTPVRSLSSRSVSRRVAVVPQDTSIAFDFAVEEIVAMGRTPYQARVGRGARRDADAVARAMERTDVAHLADRSVSQVSGGERQRVLLARAIAQDTPILLLDEPTGSLDINHQLRTLELVRKLVEDGKTVIAAIHDLDLAARYCDELALLDDGRVVEHGPPGTVLTREHLRTVFQAETAVTTNPVTGTTEVTGLPRGPEPEGSGRIHVVGGGGTAAEHLYTLAQAGFDPSVGPVPRSDPEFEAARALGLETVAVPPFTDVGDAAKAAVGSMVETAALVVVADVAVTPGNLPLLEVLRDCDRLVLVEDRPLAERNHAGVAGRELYRSVREQGTPVPSEELLDVVVDAMDDGSGARND